MQYLLIYLVVGILLILFKTPIRKLVDDELLKLQIDQIVHSKEYPKYKIVLFRMTLSSVLILIYPVMLVWWFKDSKEKRKQRLVSSLSPPEADISWLKTKITIQQAEAKNLVEIDGQLVPFGYVNVKWKNIQKNMKKNDELYEFCSPEKSWEQLAGKEGIALVRNGKIVSDIITRMN